MLYRIKQATQGKRLKAMWLLGHESNCESAWQGQDDLLSTYQEDASLFIAQLREGLGYEVPIVYSQLAAYDQVTDVTPSSPFAYSNTNLWLNIHVARNHLLELESKISNIHMVVAVDLPLGDHVHLNRVGVDTLGTRYALATRQHVYGESVNGTGPRPVSIERFDATTSRIYFDSPITDSITDYSGQWRVFTNTGHKVVTAAIRGGAGEPDVRTIWLLNADTTGYSTYHVTYCQTKRANQLTAGNHVFDVDGLPCPGFTMSL
jgi:hypothetical protein